VQDRPQALRPAGAPGARRLGLSAALLGLALPLLLGGSAHGQSPEPDCAGPAGDPEPGTLAWEQREAENAYCATQRNLDLAANPAYYQALATQTRLVAMDPMREPLDWDGKRFRFEELSIRQADGKELPAFLFRPCDSSCGEMPNGLRPHEPPYPGVVIMHGGAANQEMYLWASEALAEAGYMVLSVNLDDRTDGGHSEATKTGLDWLLSTPAAPSVDGSHNPHHAELDHERIGLAGHSAGGVAVSRLGQEDPRASAIVSWDRAQSGPMPEELALRTPALFLTADFNCQRVPVCLPERRETPPDPLGPGNKDEDFQRLRAAGVDTMKIALRAATHLDFTEWNPLNASRYGAVTTLYYTRAWFDRYLGGARDPALADNALGRLTAERFDDSADLHNISSGRWDPGTQQNVPARIADQRVADRLSFHFRSGYWLEGGARRCEQMRAGCAAPEPGLDPDPGPAPGPGAAASPRPNPSSAAPAPRARHRRCAKLRRKLRKLKRARPASAGKRRKVKRAKRKARRQIRARGCGRGR
jgi:dienelactone hydrolase